MRRPLSLALAVAVIAATLGFASSATAVDTAPAPTATPASPVAGQSFTISGNIGTTGSRTVELQRLGSSWSKYRTATTTSSGDYSFTAMTTEAERTFRVHAPSTSCEPAVDSDSLIVTTVQPAPEDVAPTGAVTGKLTESPTTYSAGDTISIKANFPNGRFPITLYKEDSPNTWTAVATRNSNSSGDATFSGFPVTTASQRVFARKANNTRTEVDTITPTPVATLSIRRDCTGNDCGMTATARGTLDPVEEGRGFKLQRKSGSSWVSVGSAATTDADGKVQIPFSLSGVPQWTTRTYRLTSAATGGSPTVTSRQIEFMPGPTTLGTNVLRVDVDKGVYPTTKGPEYTGAATLSVDGATTFDHVAVEKFGVRGNSTAKWVKKPYKLKFLSKPPKGSTVFGMPRHKSWTLLASFKDLSLVRDKVGLDLGRRMDNIAWTPESRFVEMFVNDQYRGSYLMTESVKIDGDRVDVDETHGMIMETDGDTVVDSSLGFMSTIGKIVFAFKDPDERKDGGSDPTGVTDDKFAAIKDRINAFESKLYASSHSHGVSRLHRRRLRDRRPSRAGVRQERRRRVLAEPLLLLGSLGPGRASGNPLRDGTFHFGPVWDFDGSAGNVCTCSSSADYIASPQGWMMRGTGSGTTTRTYRTHWFVQLFKDPAFESAVKARWAEVKDEFAKVYLAETAEDKAEVGVGAANDRSRWPSSTRPRKSRGTYDDEVAFVTKWYKDRYTWMDGQLSN